MQQDLSEDPGMCTAKCQVERSPKSHNGWTSAKDEYLVKMQVSRSPFIPTINAITSSQELQWMVQPAVLASMSAPCLRSHPYDPLDTSSLGPLNLTRLGVIQTIGNTHGRSRRNTQLNPDEEERRSLRRERNKLAAAKCRHRRRELTDQLQGVTEELEKEQASLQTEVERLQEEREKLELILASHASVCRLLCDGQPQTLPLTMHPTEACPHPRNPSMVKQEPQEEAQFSLHPEHPTMKPTYHHHHHHNQMEEYCPSADCFSIHSMVGCSPSHVVDLSNPMLSHASLGEQDRASSREEAFPKDLVSKPHPNNSARSLEDGPLALLYSPTLLTL